VPILVAALLVVPVLFIEESDVSTGWKTFGELLNWAIWLAFAAEVIVMLAVVPSRLKWLRENPLEFAIVVLTPPSSRRVCKLFDYFDCYESSAFCASLGSHVVSSQSKACAMSHYSRC